MNIRKLLVEYRDYFDDIKKRYKDLYPLFEDYEEEYYLKEKGKDFIENVYAKFFEMFENRFNTIFDIDIKKTENVIFVLNLKEVNFENKYEKNYISSFSCKKQDIFDKMSEEFCLWNDNLPRVEHYCYDFTPLDELLGTDVFYSNNIDELDVVCTILKQITAHGFTEEDRKESFDDLCAKLDESLKDVEEGRVVDENTFFAELEQEILDSCKTEEEKNSIITKREEKKKNEHRDTLFWHLVLKINHKECIKLIEEWCINEILKGNLN